MKRITSLILVTLLVVSLFVFVGCSNTDEMQQKIEDLQQVLQTQTEILTGLQNINASNAIQIANLQAALQEQAKQIEDIQNTNANNATQIANLQTALQEQAKQIEDMQKEMGEIILSYLSYKFSAIEEIESYANSKGQSNYLAENWVYVTNLVEMAKEQIGKQETKEEVDLLLPKIKKSIDLVPNDVVLEEKVTWNGEYIDNGFIYLDVEKNFENKEFCLDDFWMLDNIKKCSMFQSVQSPYAPYNYVEIQLNQPDQQMLTDTIRILEKLCFCKKVVYGVFGSYF